MGQCLSCMRRTAMKLTMIKDKLFAEVSKESTISIEAREVETYDSPLKNNIE